MFYDSVCLKDTQSTRTVDQDFTFRTTERRAIVMKNGKSAEFRSECGRTKCFSGSCYPNALMF